MKAPGPIKNLLNSVSGWLQGQPEPDVSETASPPDSHRPVAKEQAEHKSDIPDSRPGFVPPADPETGGPDSRSADLEATQHLRGPAGFKSRDTVPVSGSPGGGSESKSGVVQSSSEDTSYRIRNQVVDQIRDRYTKYGETMAAAMLSRALTERGLHMVLEKLDLKSSGRPEWDHDQIERYISDHSLEQFCQKVGIRFEAIKAEQEQREQSRNRIEHLTASQSEIMKSASEKKTSAKDSTGPVQRLKVRPVPTPRKDGTGSSRKDGTSSSRNKVPSSIIPQKLSGNTSHGDMADSQPAEHKRQTPSPRPIEGKALRPPPMPPGDDSAKGADIDSPVHPSDPAESRETIRRFLDEELDSHRGKPPSDRR